VTSLININVTPARNNFVKRDSRLMEVYVLDYGDNYHRGDNEPSTEFEREVRNIKARYRDINKYYYAMSLYKEYMEYLAEKHGGMDLFKLKKKRGLIEDYVPPKPRIKNTKELKFLKKHNIIVSNTGRYLIDDDKFDEYLEENYYSPNSKGEDTIVKQSKDKIVEDIYYDSSSNTKMKNIKSQSFKDDFDYLDNYFRNKNFNSKKDKKKKKKKNKDNNKVLISELMRADYDQYYYGKDEYMEDSDTGYAVYNNMMLSTGTMKELDIYHKLNDLGWNSYKLMKKNSYSKRVASVFKPPKKKKKNKKKSAYNKDYDGLLIDIMTDSGFDTDDMDSFAEFQKEMLNMTSANVFK